MATLDNVNLLQHVARDRITLQCLQKELRAAYATIDRLRATVAELREKERAASANSDSSSVSSVESSATTSSVDADAASVKSASSNPTHVAKPIPMQRHVPTGLVSLQAAAMMQYQQQLVWSQCLSGATARYALPRGSPSGMVFPGMYRAAHPTPVRSPFTAASPAPAATPHLHFPSGGASNITNPAKGGGKKGKLDAWERTLTDEFVAAVKQRRVVVSKGNLARALRQHVNLERHQDFYEKLVSRRKLNTVLAPYLAPRLPKRARQSETFTPSARPRKAQRLAAAAASE